MARKQNAAEAIETAAQLQAEIAMPPKPKPAFAIKHDRHLTGSGKEVKLSDLRALVREASYRGFSEHASVSVMHIDRNGIFAPGGTTITIHDAKEEHING